LPGGGRERARFQKSRKSGLDRSDADNPAQLYRLACGLSPNKSQRELISEQVSDLDLWHATIEHWMQHHWNPRNIPGMLELYSRGGPSACRYCHKASSPEHRLTPLEASYAALEEVRKELFGGKS